MKRQSFLLTAVAAVMLLPGIGAPLAAQPPASGGNQIGFGPGGPAPVGMWMGGRNNGMMDPTHSAAMLLLHRNDVRSELLISAQQREQLDSLDTAVQKDLRDKMMTAMQSVDFQSMAGLSPDERQAKLQEIRNQSLTIRQNNETETDKRLSKLLNARQYARLHELDYQWRGPLAIVDKKVADALTLTPEQSTKAMANYQAYTTASSKAIQAAMGDVRALFTGGNGAAPLSREQVQKEMQKRMASAQPAIEKAKKDAGDKTLELLTPEQKTKWKEMQGRPFIFRTNDE